MNYNADGLCRSQEMQNSTECAVFRKLYIALVHKTLFMNFVVSQDADFQRAFLLCNHIAIGLPLNYSCSYKILTLKF